MRCLGMLSCDWSAISVKELYVILLDAVSWHAALWLVSNISKGLYVNLLDAVSWHAVLWLVSNISKEIIHHLIGCSVLACCPVIGQIIRKVFFLQINYSVFYHATLDNNSNAVHVLYKKTFNLYLTSVLVANFVRYLGYTQNRTKWG